MLCILFAKYSTMHEYLKQERGVLVHAFACLCVWVLAHATVAVPASLTALQTCCSVCMFACWYASAGSCTYRSSDVLGLC